MKQYDYWIIDSFSELPYMGNPAAVVFDADDLPDTRKQTIARYLNLSETVFLCRPGAEQADYRARIFTPREEVPFAGHPTVASAFAYYSRLPVEARRTTAQLIQECGIGPVRVEVGNRNGAPFFELTAGKASAQEAEVTPELAGRMLGCADRDLAGLPIEVCSGGLPWLIIKLKSPAITTKLLPDQSLIEKVCRTCGAVGITVYCDGGELEGVDFHVRSFAPGFGITEDPACGSGNIALAIHKARHGNPGTLADRFVSEQGLEIGRQALLYLNLQDSSGEDWVIRLGGHAVRTMEGRLQA